MSYRSRKYSECTVRLVSGGLAYGANTARQSKLCTPSSYRVGGTLEIIGSETNVETCDNSVVGARTNKYGDFLDVCAALVQRAPWADLHTDEGRRGKVLIDGPDAAKLAHALRPIP